MSDIYDDIRPFTDAEAARELPKLADSAMVVKAGRFFFADKPDDYLPSLIRSCRSVNDFQEKVVSQIVERDLELTHSQLSYSGIENLLDADGKMGCFVFLSTHRDIVLDPAFLEFALFKNGLPESEIAAGDNLLASREIEIAMRSNRMITVVRSDNPRVVYESSKKLSSYIRERVSSKQQSVWISHRGGRTKDGNDRTEQGLLKMLDMSGKGSFLENFMELNIVPVTISYEYETCGALKALETLTKERQGFYKKQPGEDVNSMLQGFLQHKGRIHVDFGKPLTEEELLQADSAQRNDKFRILANILDQKLKASFHLWPTNYAAADMVTGRSDYLQQGLYTAEDRERLETRLRKESEGMPPEIYSRMVKLYAAHII
ncbi:MAG: 1-acyl-sn-glycerol-3-phosphate acyltransferase [Bacteroidales bacterium]|nr:1-acyl-sn-glycerol-3-phosphate acyltransferase [Bacteroidales bacterium]